MAKRETDPVLQEKIRMSAYRVSVAATVLATTNGNRAQGLFKKRLKHYYKVSKNEVLQFLKDNPQKDQKCFEKTTEFVDRLILS